MQLVTLEEAAAHLGHLIQKAHEEGNEVVITRNDQPIARLVPLPPPARPPRQPGSAKGLIQIPDDFDAPLNDFAEYQ